MAAGTQVRLVSRDSEITASCNVSGSNIIYYGHADGYVYSYDAVAGTLTKLGKCAGSVRTMALYSGVLYVGVSGGWVYSFTTS